MRPAVSLPSILLVHLFSLAPIVPPPSARATEPTTFAPAATASASKRWTADDLLLAEQAGEFAVSPDGQWAVWVKTAMDKEKGEQVSNLVLSRLGGDSLEIALTRGKDRCRNPRWAPDGQTIAFLGTRPLPEKKGDDEKTAKTQLWLIRAQGGEPWPLTTLDREIRGFAWRDKDTLVLALPEAKSLFEQTVEKDKDTSRAVEDAEREPPVRLWSVSIKGGAPSRLTNNRDWIEWVQVSPDGRWAVTLHAQSLSFQFDHRVPPVLKVTDLVSGRTRALLEGQRLLPVAARWASDSKGFYFVHQYSSHPTYFTASIELLQYVDAESGRATPVDLQWKRGLGSARIQPTADGFIALLADGVRQRPARYTRTADGWTRQELSGEHVRNIVDWALGGDGATLVYDHSSASTPDQWYRGRLAGATIESPVRLTDLNPGFKGKPVHRSEVVRWRGARDEEVEGILYYPLEYREGTRAPLFLSIHGGPLGADGDYWDQGYAYPKLLLAQRGAFLLEVNYHGSSGYGLEWAESICCGNYYDLERVDLEKGADYVIGRGLADPERLGSIGWSNGAILTTELVTRSRRFKAASAGAGDVEWISDWGNVDFGASFDNYYFGKAPYEDPDLYIRKSPYFRLKDVTTPIILYTGTDDRNVPPSQSWSHFRVLQQVGRTPVRFVLFPGEPHGLGKYVHQKRKIDEDMAWFDTHLFGTKPVEAVVKEGSPLEAALARKGFARSGGLFGRTVKGKLVPEAVAYEGLLMGRFEVTRAQYAAFESQGRFAPGTANLPANGITFEQAKAYAAWLARLTGEPWRLPSAAEVKDLYDAARGDENTLDHWAGYAPNPEDAERVRQRAAELGGSAPLLEEVGRHMGRGDSEKVYDLGGNVAEWASGADGRGVLVGGSADQPAAGAEAAASAAGAYRGLRVVAGDARRKPE
jgi:dipeptidyl aminopeptidase/acylaminoacyl peptidase